MSEFTENTVPVQSAPTEESSEMAAIYDRMTKDGIDDEPSEVSDGEDDGGAQQPPAIEGSEGQEAQAEGPQAVEAPGDLPHEWKEHWANIPESARDGMLASYRQLTGKLSHQGRQLQQFQGAAPVLDALREAVTSVPGLAEMAPAQVAQDVFRLAKLQSRLASEPLSVIMEVAQNYGVIDQLRAHVSGQAVQATPGIDVAQFRQQLQQLTNPENIGHIVDQVLAQRDGAGLVESFAKQAPHWEAVEGEIPDFLPIVQARMPGAGHKEILQAAYDMACYADPSIRAKQAAATAPVQASPVMTEAQRKAKSINVVSKPGRAAPLSERDEMGAVWDRMTS